MIYCMLLTNTERFGKRFEIHYGWQTCCHILYFKSEIILFTFTETFTAFIFCFMLLEKEDCKIWNFVTSRLVFHANFRNACIIKSIFSSSISSKHLIVNVVFFGNLQSVSSSTVATITVEEGIIPAVDSHPVAFMPTPFSACAHCWVPLTILVTLLCTHATEGRGSDCDLLTVNGEQ